MALDLAEHRMPSFGYHFSGPTLNVFTCPSCKKRRLHRRFDHTVSTEKRKVTTADGEEIEHFIDICTFCVDKLTKKVYTPSKKELRKVLKALHDPSADLGDKSLEELL